MAGVDTVVGRGYVDTSRMYVSGCSGGGVLSSWVIGHTDRFAAAAVRCPVIDWLSMAGHTDVPLFTYSFFKKPFWEDPSDWLSHSSLMTVGKVTTPTLLMTGVLDRRTPMPQTEEYYAALKVKGVPVKLLQFNEEYHGTGSKPSNYIRTQLYMMSWFKQWTRQPAARCRRPPHRSPKGLRHFATMCGAGLQPCGGDDVTTDARNRWCDARHCGSRASCSGAGAGRHRDQGRAAARS
jgi:acetyl esterase/lipase